jgi:hypothetical protein
MKMRWPRGKKNIDEQKVQERKEAKLDMRSLLLCGDEQGYVQLVKALRPETTPEELVSLVLRFREERRNLRLGTGNQP